MKILNTPKFEPVFLSNWNVSQMKNSTSDLTWLVSHKIHTLSYKATFSLICIKFCLKYE